jgi:hypothetical protein
MYITSKDLSENWHLGVFSASQEHAQRKFDFPEGIICLQYTLDYGEYYLYTGYEITINLETSNDITFLYNDDIKTLLVNDIIKIGGCNKKLEPILEKYLRFMPPILDRREITKTGLIWNKLRLGSYACLEITNKFKPLDKQEWDCLDIQIILNMKGKTGYIRGVIADWCDCNCKGIVYFQGHTLMFEYKEDAMRFKLTWL